MKYICISFFVILLFFSCKNQSSNDIKRISITPQIISHEVFSSLPGSILVYENELVWIDHSSVDDFIHILDKKTGEDKNTFGSIGGGPEEFFSPEITQGVNRELLIYDLNSPKILSFSLDSVIAGKETPVKIELAENDFGKIRLLEIDENKYTLFGLEDSQPFLFVDNEEVSLFGKYPVEKNVEIANKFDVFQGTVLYNKQNKVLLYSAGDMSYISMYKYDDGHFRQKWEKYLSKVEYTISDRFLRIFETPRHAPTALSMTKDYIVSIERDEDQMAKPSIKKSGGRDFSRLPQTLFIYDYDMILEKIVNVGFPVLRIASTGYDNEIYLIGANPELCIGMVSL